jgi:hypothetical protein
VTGTPSHALDECNRRRGDRHVQQQRWVIAIFCGALFYLSEASRQPYRTMFFWILVPIIAGVIAAGVIYGRRRPSKPPA